MVFDGGKKLCKDEIMMSTEWDVGGALGELDFWTLRRAEAFLEGRGVGVC